MDLTRLVTTLISFALGAGLALYALRAISQGLVKPFRMARWSDPEEVSREEAPASFWVWVLAYFGLSGIAFLVSLLTALGRLKAR